MILPIHEAEIRRLVIQVVHETLSQQNQPQKKGGGMVLGVCPEFNPQYHKKVPRT
jgi:hypothetical protein